ncbi:MAG: type II CAAX endopeptidase family protein [Candidatus Thermoplasmatota archaeon]|nr:type II CAAX endopeptidase family protein [Candidatus Thermoplasmatota archaeon]
MDYRKLMAGMILIIPFFYIYGLSILSLSIPIGNGSFITPSTIFFSLVMNLVVMAGSSMLCIYVLYGGGLKAIARRLYFRKERAFQSVMVGIFTAVIFLFIITAFVYFLQAMGYGTENELAEKIVENINLPLLFAIPFLSALSEETFFRAFIQMRTAKYGQPFAIFLSSLLFGLAHMSYKNPLQIAIPFLLGIALGYIMMKNENILAPFSAHFAFNFVQLAAAFSM